MNHGKRIHTGHSFFYFIFIFLFFLIPFPLSAKDIPIDKDGNTVFNQGGVFVQSHPKIKYPVWMFNCKRTDLHAEECLDGGWEDVYFEKEFTPKRINVSVFATPQQAQTALEMYIKLDEASLKKSFQAEDDKRKKNKRITDIIREVIQLTVPGADAGYLREYKRSYKEHSEKDNRSGSRTSHYFQIRGAYRKGLVVFTLNESVGGFWEGYQGEYWSYIFSDTNRGKRISGDDKNEQNFYELQKKQIIDFTAEVIPFAKKIEDAWLACYSEFKNEFLSGKDFSDMGLAELVDLTSKKLISKSFNYYRRDMENRLNAMKNSESLNPEYPDLYSEFVSCENDPRILIIHKWHKPLKTYVEESKAFQQEFAPLWETFGAEISSYYLYTIKTRLEKGEKLSDARLKILRRGMIIQGTTYYSLQHIREKPLSYGIPTRTLSRQSVFDILTMTGSSSGVRDDAFLSVEASSKKLKVDGNSSTVLTISLFEKTSADNSAGTPLKGKTITIKNVPYNGIPVGNISHQSLTTDNHGRGELIYTAPAKDDLPRGPVPRAEIIIQCAELNLEETLYIDLYAGDNIQIKPEFTILPAHKDYKNELAFRFETPEKDWGKKFKAIVKSKSANGRLMSADNQTPLREIIFEAVSGTDNIITYFWDGPMPTDSAIEEQISIEIPDLDLSGVQTFSVGIDLMADEAIVSWKPPFQPFLTIPVKVYIKDRFHPDADILQLFSDFQIKPKIRVEQTGFKPPAILSGSKSGEDELLSSVSTFIEQSTRGRQGSNSLTRDIVTGTVKKTKDNRWLLVSKDLSGEGIPVDQMFPAIIPFVRGTFNISVTLEPDFKGDALTEGHIKKLPPIEVSRVSAQQGELDFFLLPTLKAVAGLTPQGGLGFGLTDIALKTRAGDYQGAIITAGQMMAGKIIGDGLGDKMKAGYKQAMNTFYREQTAKAFGTTVNALHPRQAELALRLAKPYKLASWVETVTGWAVDKTIENMTSSSLEEVPPPAFPGDFFTALSELIIPSAHAGELPDINSIMDQTLDFLALFSKGYGNEYGVVVITRAGLDKIIATDSEGNQLRNIPESVFAGKDRLEMIRTGKHVVVIPFEKGKNITLEMTGHGAPVEIYKILDNTVTKGVLDYQGKPWKKSLKVNG